MKIWHQGFVDFELVPVYRRSFADHIAKVIDPGVEVTIHGLRPGTFGAGLTPIEALRSPYVEAILSQQICEAALCAERNGYNAVAINCFYDPALREARSLVDIPVVSLFESTVLTALSLGRSVGMLALNNDQCDKHKELAAGYGVSARLAATVPITPSIDEYVLESGPEETAEIVEGISRAVRVLRAAGAEIIVPGDGVLNDFIWRRELSIDGVEIMDSAGVLLRHATYLVGLRSKLGLGTARTHFYAKPYEAVLADMRKFDGRRPLDEQDFSGVSTVSAAPSSTRAE